jgi:SAM-dependent methyltransferase
MQVMLEIDGRVASAADLVRRVQDVLARTDRGELSFARAVPPSPDNQTAVLPTAPRAEAMQDRADAIQAPPILVGPGPVGRVKRFGKKVVRKLTFWYVEPRWVPQREFDVETASFARDVNRALDDVTDSIAETRSYARRVGDRTRMLAFDANDMATSVAAIQDTVFELRTALATIEQRIDDLQFSYAKSTEVELLHHEVRGVLDRLGAASAAAGDIDYVAFEDRFRGASEDLRELQREYLQYLPPPEAPGLVVDIGCGRGEMLELLTDAGYHAIGVDPDAGMVDASREKGLNVVVANGLTWLVDQPDGSINAILCLQVVEHLFTSELVAFVRQARQKLQAGGVLVMETINPRSWHAFSNHFLADTSHIRPVYPETLRFLCQEAGFDRVELAERARHTLMDAASGMRAGATRNALEALLRGVFGFQDYAIIATK